jgi:putative endonuclease
MFYVYILISEKDHRTYVGFTSDLQRRIEKHNSGMVKSTKYRRPLKILFYETFSTSPEAKKRETYWKSGAGRRKLKGILDCPT